jgi:hypothetical protein
MSISPQSLSDLQSKCGLPPADCRAALTQHAGDVDAALASLIDAGKVQPDQLNPDTVSDELFDRAAKLQKLNFYRSMTDPAGPTSIFGKLLGGLGDNNDGKPNELASMFQQALAEQFGNKTPEQMMADDEAHAAKRFEDAQSSIPELANVKRITPAEQARISAKVKRRSEFLKSHPFTLDLPPFPPLKLEMHEWTGQGTLKAFAGSQQRHGGYTSLSSKKPSKGTFSLDIPRLDDDDANPKPPAPEQLAAYAHLIDNQDAVVESILTSLLKYYTKLRKSWLKNQPDLDLPDITTRAEMKKNVGLGTLHMHPVAKAGHAYLGLELGCTWDEEHGTGILLHQSRILDIGQADTSFNTHTALADGATPLKPH